MSTLLYSSNLLTLLHLVIVVVILFRVVMKRPSTGVALAWLLLVAGVPFGGALLYLLIGERRIGLQRFERLGDLRHKARMITDAAIQEGLTDVDWSRHAPTAKAMDQIGRNTSHSATVQGSRFEMISDTQQMLRAIARDIDQANQSVLIEFYIWSEGGTADDVADAVVRASKRGVVCYVLVDAVGGRPWWRGKQPQRMRDAGVNLLPALPVGIFRTFVGRTDLRLHRKIVVVDGEIAWTGSMNLVDPRYFKQDAGVGEWVDAMVRLEGAVVAPLAATMIGDWSLETGTSIMQLVEQAGLRFVRPDGPADIQVIASGPGQTDDDLLQMILAQIHTANDELILTTPYLVPDESLLRALRGAASRNVKVSLIVPNKVDSFMARYACRSYYEDLMSVGVQIFHFKGGLLHTKSIMVDGAISMFGTVNLDMRSLWLNYEVSLFVYDTGFAESLRKLQMSYIEDSELIVPEEWETRPFHERFLENTFRLMSPLL